MGKKWLQCSVKLLIDGKKPYEIFDANGNAKLALYAEEQVG